ncbi:MAG: transposase [Desulfovibrionaceae bacterium]
MIPFVEEAAGQFAGVVWPVAVLGHEANKTRIEDVPFAERGRCFGHVAQPLQFLIGPGATRGDLLVFSFRESFGVVASASRLEFYRPEHFGRAEELTSSLGLGPMVSQSGESKARRHLRPVGQRRLRSLLNENGGLSPYRIGTWRARRE